ncbi:MAG: hypothetical protein MK081_03475 [Flavobacteriales bacterium]|nr:hypothetical protein [Flavobacteriales bacterium]
MKTADLNIENWRGNAFLTSEITEVLLWLEEQLDEEQSTFLKLAGVKDLVRNQPSLSSQFTLLTDAALAWFLSIDRQRVFTAIKPEKFVPIILEMSSDNSCSTLLLSEKGGKLIGSKAFSKRKRKTRTFDARRHSNHELIETIVSNKIEFVVSEWNDERAERLFNHLVNKLGKPLVWVQLPQRQLNTEVQSVFHQKWHMLNGKLRLIWGA